MLVCCTCDTQQVRWWAEEMSRNRKHHYDLNARKGGFDADVEAHPGEPWKTGTESHKFGASNMEMKTISTSSAIPSTNLNHWRSRPWLCMRWRSMAEDLARKTTRRLMRKWKTTGVVRTRDNPFQGRGESTTNITVGKSRDVWIVRESFEDAGMSPRLETIRTQTDRLGLWSNGNE